MNNMFGIKLYCKWNKKNSAEHAVDRDRLYGAIKLVAMTKL
jgi:hypothetical protein